MNKVLPSSYEACGTTTIKIFKYNRIFFTVPLHTLHNTINLSIPVTLRTLFLHCFHFVVEFPGFRLEYLVAVEDARSQR